MPLLNRYSIRQILGLTALAAVAAVVARQFRLDNTLATACLLAPLILYAVLWASGVVLRPARWLAERPLLSLSIPLLVAAGTPIWIRPWSVVAMLPLLAFWFPQVAIAQLAALKLAASNQAGRDGRSANYASWRSGVSELLLMTAGSLLLALALLVQSVYGLGHSIVGKGTAFNRYWMIVASGATTEYMWQQGHSDIRWSWVHRSARMVPAAHQHDWKFLGLERYRVGSIEKLRVPVWLPLGFAVVPPGVWLALRLRSTHASGVDHYGSEIAARSI